MNCPNCAQAMEDGWLATFNPILWLTFVVWQATEPGYLRLFRPAGSEKVIVPRSGGRGCPKAQLYRACKAVVFCYAENQLALNVVTRHVSKERRRVTHRTLVTSRRGRG